MEIHSLFAPQLEGKKSRGSLSLCASDWRPQSKEMSTLSSIVLYASETILGISQEEIQTRVSPRTFLEKGIYLLRYGTLVTSQLGCTVRSQDWDIAGLSEEMTDLGSIRKRTNYLTVHCHRPSTVPGTW